MYRAGASNINYNRFLSTITVPAALLNADNSSLPISVGDGDMTVDYYVSGNSIMTKCNHTYIYALVIGCRW